MSSLINGRAIGPEEEGIKGPRKGVVCCNEPL